MLLFSACTDIPSCTLVKWSPQRYTIHETDKAATIFALPCVAALLLCRHDVACFTFVQHRDEDFKFATAHGLLHVIQRDLTTSQQ